MSTTHRSLENEAAAAPPGYGQWVALSTAAGVPLRFGVFNEHAVRAAAGLTMALGAVAFAYAALAQVYLPIQTVTLLFFVEFAARVRWGVHRSPLGLLAQWLTRRQPPLWVSAQPKRFAWSLGLVMSAAMALITNAGIRGALPLSICVVCLALMWMEAVLGLCLGCEIHAALVRRGWVAKGAGYEICSHDVCDLQANGRGAA